MLSVFLVVDSGTGLHVFISQIFLGFVCGMCWETGDFV